jgi:tRNA-Thr(GGU) m(6)t(6)A37 methyltransferase TsaA
VSSAESEFRVQAIGFVASPRDEAIDDDWGAIEATVTLTAAYTEASLRGLDEFSHVDVVFLFDRVDPADVQTGARVPRNNPAWPEVGIFAQRAKMRPNRIAVSTCELLEVRGTTIRVRGLDAIDGTPVIDLKPYLAEFGPRGPTTQPPWSHELMAGYY